MSTMDSIVIDTAVAMIFVKLFDWYSVSVVELGIVLIILVSIFVVAESMHIIIIAFRL